MQLEELERQWQVLSERLEQRLNLDREVLRLMVLRSARQRVNRGAVWPALDIAFCLAVLLVTGSTVGNHWGSWSFVVPAGIVMAATILLLVDSIRQLNGLSEIDWGGAVADIQASLSRLQLARIRQFKWVILLSPLVWICALIVGLQWLLDRQPEPPLILDKLNPWWVAVNYAFGLLFIPFGHAVIGFLAGRFQSRGWWQRALADVSGSGMKQAREELERWAHAEELPRDIPAQ